MEWADRVGERGTWRERRGAWAGQRWPWSLSLSPPSQVGGEWRLRVWAPSDVTSCQWLSWVCFCIRSEPFLPPYNKSPCYSSARCLLSQTTTTTTAIMSTDVPPVIPPVQTESPSQEWASKTANALKPTPEALRTPSDPRVPGAFREHSSKGTNTNTTIPVSENSHQFFLPVAQFLSKGVGGTTQEVFRE